MSDYRNLDVWQKAHSLALDIYRVSGELPASERYAAESGATIGCVDRHQHCKRIRPIDGSRLRSILVNSNRLGM